MIQLDPALGAMLGVAAHQFVRALTRQNHLHRTRGQLRQDKDRDVCRLGYWRTSPQDSYGPLLHKLMWIHHDFVVVGIETLRDRPCELELGILALAKAYREGAHLFRT